MMTCDRYRDLLELLRDGGIEGTDAREAKLHGASCEACMAWELESDAMVAPLRDLPPGPYLPDGSGWKPPFGGWPGAMLLLLLLFGGVPLLASVTRPDLPVEVGSVPADLQPATDEASSADTTEEAAVPPDMVPGRTGECWLTGRIVRHEDWTAMEGVQVAIEGQSTTTDQYGLFRVDGLPENVRMTMKVSGGPCQPLVLNVPALIGGRPNDLDDITLGEPVSFKVLVRDILDNPVEGATVKLFKQARMLAIELEGEDDERTFSVAHVSRTDAGGTANFEGIDPGEYYLLGDVKHLAPSWPREIRVPVAAHGELTLSIITLLPPTRVSGTVTIARAGAAVPDAVVTVSDDAVPVHRFIPEWRTMTDESGAFTLHRMPRRLVPLEARVGPFSYSGTVAVDAARRPSIDISVWPAQRRELEVQDSDSAQALAHQTVLVSGRSDGNVVFRQFVTDESGAIEFDLPNRTTIWASADPLGEWCPPQARGGLEIRAPRPKSTTPTRLRIWRGGTQDVTATTEESSRGRIAVLLPATRNHVTVSPSPRVWRVRVGSSGSIHIPRIFLYGGWKIGLAESSSADSTMGSIIELESLVAGQEEPSPPPTAPASEPEVRDVKRVLAQGVIRSATPARDEGLRLYLGSAFRSAPRCPDALIRVREDGSFAITIDDARNAGWKATKSDALRLSCTGSTVWDTHRLLRLPSTDPIEVTPPPLRTVTGVFLDEDGGPIAQALVQWVAFSDSSLIETRELSINSSTTTDVDGSFRLTEVSPGAVKLMLTRSNTDERTWCTVPPYDSHAVVRKRPLGQLRVRVTDDSHRPVAGADVSAYSLGLSAVGGRATSDGDGWATIAVPMDGALEVRVRPARAPGATDFKWYTSKPLAAGTRETTVRLDPATTMKGRLVDQEGKPFDGARLTLFAVGKGWAYTSTDEDGVFQFADSGAAPRTLRIRSASGETWDVDLPAGDLSPSVRLRRPRKRTSPDDGWVRLQVLTAEGLPLRRGNVSLHPTDHNRSPPVETFNVVDGETRARVPLEEPMTLRVWTEGETLLPSEPIAPSDDPVVIRLRQVRPGSLDGIVVGRDGAPVQDARVVGTRRAAIRGSTIFRPAALVSVQRLNGSPLAEFVDVRTSSTDIEGRFSLGSPTNGDWIVGVVATRSPWESARLVRWNREDDRPVVLEAHRTWPLRLTFAEGQTRVEEVQVVEVAWTRPMAEEALKTVVHVRRDEYGYHSWPAAPNLPITVTARIVGKEKTWTFQRPGEGEVAILDFGDMEDDVRIEKE